MSKRGKQGSQLAAQTAAPVAQSSPARPPAKNAVLTAFSLILLGLWLVFLLATALFS